MNKIWPILLIALPVLVMIGLIPVTSNDYILTLVYIVMIVGLLRLKCERHDKKIFLFGLIFMIISEYVFTSTGVETFNRTTLFNLMPIWLPLLWGYGFVAIKRSIHVLNS